MAATALGPGPLAYTDGVADGLVVWLFCLAVLPGRFALPFTWPFTWPLAWPPCLALSAGPLGRSSGLVIWPGLFGAGSGLRMPALLLGVGSRRVHPRSGRRVGSEYTRNILAIYSEYTMNLQSVARRSRALRAAAPDPAPHAGTSALASELRLGAGVSLAQGLR